MAKHLENALKELNAALNLACDAGDGERIEALATARAQIRFQLDLVLAGK
jgi:hypothetical protein